MIGFGQNQKKRGCRFRLRWMLAGLLLGIVVGLTILALRGGGMTFGPTAVSFSFERDGEQEEWFAHHVWDGPTGEFTSGRVLGMRVPFGLLRLGVRHDPKAAMRRRLPSSIPGLMKCLQSNDRFEVDCAVEVLGERQGAAVSALPGLIAAAERGLSTFSAVDSIAKAAPTQSVALLSSALSTTNLHLRTRLAGVLGELGTNATSAVPDLYRAFKNALPGHQPAMAFAIWQITGDCGATLPILRHNLANLAMSEVRVFTFHIIGQFGGQAASAIPEIIHALQATPEPREMSGAVAALGKIGERPDLAVPAILSVLAKTNSDSADGRLVRAYAVGALGGFGSAGAPSLIAIYKGTNARETVTAAKALASIGPPAAAALDVFLEELNSPKSRRVALACEIIGKLGDKGKPAVPRLHPLLLHPDNRVKVHAASALAQLGDHSEPVLFALLDSLDSKERVGDELAFTTLGHILQTNPEMGAVLEGALRTRKNASRSIEMRKALAQRYALPL
jgi:HEAT repeat protein